jgi:hypothetical protein
MLCRFGGWTLEQRGWMLLVGFDRLGECVCVCDGDDENRMRTDSL